MRLVQNRPIIHITKQVSIEGSSENSHGDSQDRNLDAYKLSCASVLIKSDPLVYGTGNFDVDMNILTRFRSISSWTDAQTMLLSIHLCEQLLEMHLAGICHGDIRIENVLYDSRNRRYILADFELCAAENAVFITWNHPYANELLNREHDRVQLMLMLLDRVKTNRDRKIKNIKGNSALLTYSFWEKIFEKKFVCIESIRKLFVEV
jgi:serine/threonine protein kinase